MPLRPEYEALYGPPPPISMPTPPPVLGMTNPEKYESKDIYAQRQAQLEEQQRQAEEKAKLEQYRQQTPVSVGGLLTDPLGTLGRGMELVSRPLSATASGLAAMLRGEGLQGAGQGFLAGLGGTSPIRGFTDVLEQQKVNLPGELNLGPFNLTGTMAAGFAGDVLLDPLSYLPAIGMAKRGAAIAAPNLAARGRQLGAFTPVEVTPRIGPKAAGITRKISGAEGIINLIDPGAMADTVPKQAAIRYNATLVQRDNMANRITAQLKELSLHNPFANVVQGSGLKVVEFPERYWSKLDPNQREYVNRFNDLMVEAKQWGLNNGVDLGETPLGKGQRYVHHMIEEAPGVNLAPERPMPHLPGGKVSSERLRTANTIVGLEEQGYKVPEDPAESLVAYISDIGTKIADKQLLEELRPLGETIAQRVPQEIKQAAVSGRARLAAINKAVDLTQRALRGENVPLSSVRSVGDPFPELVLRLEEALAIKPASLQRALHNFADDVASELGVDRVRFNQALEMARLRRGTPLGAKLIARGDLTETLRILRKENQGALNTLEKIYQTAYQIDVKGRKAALTSLLNDAKGVLPQVQGETAKALSARAAATRTAGQTGIGEAYSKVPGLAGRIFDAEDVRQIDRLLIPHEDGIVRFLGNANAIVRFMSTTADWAAPMLQGLLLLPRYPDLFGKMWMHQFKAFFDPQVYYRMLSDPQNAAYLARHPNITVGGSEFMAAAGPQGLLRRIPGVSRFQVSFDAAGDFARIEWGKALEGTALKAGPQAVREMEEFINRATGAMSTQAMGISASQRAKEGAMFLFSPRYTRSAIAIVTDIFQGGLQGAEARKALGSLMLAGGAMYNKIGEAIGQEAHWDPRDPNFMSYQIGNDWVGIGGTYRALARMVGKAVIDPSGLINLDDDENPLIRFVRGRTAPLTGLAWDKIKGESFIGEDLEDPIDFLGHAASRLLPFALEAYLVQDPKGEWATLPGQVLGLNVNPASFRARRDTVARQRYGLPFEELDPYQQQEIASLPELQNLPLRGETGERLATQRKISENYGLEINDAAERVVNEEITLGQYREIRHEIAAKRAILLESIEPPPRALTGLNPNERAYQEYLRMLRVPGAPDETPFEQVDTFLASLSAEQQKYIEDKQLANLRYLPEPAKTLEEEYRKMLRILNPYWEVQDEILARYGLKGAWDEATPAQREVIQDSLVYKDAQKDWQEKRRDMRERNPEVDRLLVSWGYAQTPIMEQEGGYKRRHKRRKR